MNICISASLKFKRDIQEVSTILDKLGISHYLPNMNVPKELETSEMTYKLVYEHFNKISKVDAILVVNPTGYFGNSVKVEIGYAKGFGKKVYFLSKTNEPELDCLADDFVSINKLYLLKMK